jgi:hypothetical protein
MDVLLLDESKMDKQGRGIDARAASGLEKQDY